MNEPPRRYSSNESALDRIAKFFRSVAGVITAAVVLGGAIAGAVAFVKGDGDDHKSGTPPSNESSTPPPPVPPAAARSASLFTDRDSGPGGTTVRLSGDGFDPGERVVLNFHTEEVGTTTANGEGKFSNVTVTVPTSFSKFAPQQFRFVATGQSSAKSADAPFTITG